MPTARVHCTDAVERAVRKSRHRIGDACSTVCTVLALYFDRGVVVPGHVPLRKMRVAAPGLTVGKSGGYRLIYATRLIDESQHFVLLSLYYKGDREDLHAHEYETLRARSVSILGNVIDHAWTSVGGP